MRLSPSSSGQSSEQRGSGRSGSRVKKKHKKLDAICEEEYNKNHVELNEGDDALNPDSGVRRSSRVRRAPVMLDASPSPKKKRPKLGKDVIPKSVESVKSLERESGDSDGGKWSSRLRSRGGNVGLEVKEERKTPSRKRKLFEEELEVDGNDELEVDKREELEVDKKEELEVDKKEELEGLPKTVKSKKRRGKRTKHEKGHKENECQGSLDESKSEEVELVLNKGKESASVLEPESSGGIDLRDGNADSVVGNEEKVAFDNLQAEEDHSGDVERETVEHIEAVDEQGDRSESVKDGKDASDAAEIGGIDNGGLVDKDVGMDENVLNDKNTGKMDELKHASNDKSVYRHIKEGRRCGLCGRGSDGKPPKRLVQDNGESENEAYSGSSASEQPTYDTWDGFDDEPGWLGRLLGPINDRYGIAGIWVHQNCAVWSPEV